MATAAPQRLNCSTPSTLLATRWRY